MFRDTRADPPLRRYAATWAGHRPSDDREVLVSITHERRDALPRAIVILFGLAAAAVVVAGMRAGAWLIAPAALGVVLVVTVSPVRACSSGPDRRDGPASSP